MSGPAPHPGRRCDDVSCLHRSSLLIVGVICICLGVLFPLHEARAAWVIEYLGQAQSESGSLLRPTAISVDPARGEICVTDPGSNSLQVFNRHGLELFHSTGLSQLRQPKDALIDADGNFFLTEGSGGEAGRSLHQLNWLGEPTAWEFEPVVPGWRPEHLALTPQGDLVSVDTSHRVLSKHSGVDGRLLWSVQPWDERHGDEKRGGEVIIGRPAVAQDGRIYVPISTYAAVMVFDSEGERVDSFGVFGSRPGKFTFPVAVAMGPAGTVLVLDRQRQKLLLFDHNHEFQVEFLGFGTSPGRLYFPTCLAAGDDGFVFVGQGYEGRVQIYRIFDTSQGSRETPGLEVGCTAPDPLLLRIAPGIRQAIGGCAALCRVGGFAAAQGSYCAALLNVGQRGNSHSSVSRSEVA